MRRVVVSLAAVVVLAAPATAWGGGFSTVGLQPLPEDLRAGQAWTAEFTMLGHGRTPRSGMRPVLTITHPDGAGPRTFEAVESSRPGVYRARVTFPAAGSWALSVLEWRDAPAAHTFGIVRVGGPGQPLGGTAAPAASGAADGGPRALLALGAGALAAAAASVLRRRRTASKLDSTPVVGV
ncbi:MAG TPA: FixH family protein [Solirubrobacteraceae bacterium]|nr:FixH family protein [Solirubrobacteraceae bacterium]